MMQKHRQINFQDQANSPRKRNAAKHNLTQVDHFYSNE